MISIIAKDSGEKDFPICPEGSHIARCYSIMYLGHLPKEYAGQKKIKPTVRITWELPNELRVFSEENGEQPFVISKEYTLSLHEKAALGKDLQSWRGKAFSEDERAGFDISVLLGVPCMLVVVHKDVNGKTYANVAAVAGVPAGTNVPEQINPSFIYSVDPWDQDAFTALPEWLQKRVATSAEYIKALGYQHSPNDAPDEEIPDDASVDSDGLPF